MVCKDKIIELRHKTGAGIMACKDALTKSGGDIEKAIQVLRKKGLAIAAKKSGRAAKDGCVASYVHHGSKIGVLVEVNCETDFVAKTEDFKGLVKDIAMQIAATNPSYVKKEDVPKEALEKEDEEADIFYKQQCLLEQPFIKDEGISIRDYLTQVIAKVGENIVIRRFVRYQLGG